MAKFKRNNLQLKTNQKIQLGDNQQSVVQYDGTDLKLTNDGGQLTLDANGISLNSGVPINQFSNDSALGYGIDVVPTQFAVKTYVDTKVDLGMETGNLNNSRSCFCPTTRIIILFYWVFNNQYCRQSAIVIR